MSLPGKILLVVNFLVAAGLAYLIAQDWAVRQNVSGVVARSALVLDGLPTEPLPTEDDVRVDAQINGLSVVRTVRPEMLKAHFQGAEGGAAFGGGDPPKSQVEELQRVRNKANAQLAATGGPADRLALLAGRFDAKGAFTPGWLAALAESYDERQLVRSLAAASPLPGQPAADPQALEGAVKTADAMLTRRFEAALAKPNPQLAAEETAKLKELSEAIRKADEAARAANKQFVANPNNPAATKALTDALAALEQAFRDQRQFLSTAGNSAPRDEPDRRRRIAHLLAHLDRDAAWQKRVALVVGLRTYLAAIQDQVNRLRAMTAGAQQQQVLDQADFSETYDLLKNLAMERAMLFDQQQALTADLAVQRRRDQEAVAQRNAQLQRRELELKELQGQVAAALARQAEVEQGLLSVQKRVAETQQHNLDLLKQVDTAEQKK
ncbi:MAG TPA: hypothetical protein VFG68_15340 [Fimbriiglobus sp.]|nr:hypothetical protein [Fimbriiglobus sp.]